MGNLESRELGPISRVWSEPGVVDAAAYEFAETAKFLEAGVVHFITVFIACLIPASF